LLRQIEELAEGLPPVLFSLPSTAQVTNDSL